MPDEEVDQHEIAIVFELVGVAYRLVHALHRPQLERMHLAVMGARNEVAKVLVARAAYYSAAGDVTRARDGLERAQAMFISLGTSDGPPLAASLLESLPADRNTDRITTG